MPPAVVAGAPRKMIDPVKHGKFSVKIGDSLKDASSGKKRLTSLKYNHKPSPALNNGRKSTLKSTSGGAGNEEVTVEITPNDAAEPPVTFSGAQGPAKKTECVLIYDPATGTFTLEKLLSTFTLNLTSAGANVHPPLSLPKWNPGHSDDSASDDGSSDGDATKADKENPFDYRHFINNKFEVPTTSSRLRDDKDRKQRLEKFHEELSDPNASADSEEVEEDSGGLIIDENPVAVTPTPIRQTLPARPRAPPSIAAPKPRAKPTPKTPAANKKSAANGPISLSSTAKKGAIPTEEIDLTPTSHPSTSHKRPHDEISSSESDADNESDESDEDDNEFAGSGELIIEGEDPDDGRNNRSRSTTAGLGSSWIGGNRGGPISLSTAAQGDVEMESDDDEEEEEEEPMAPSPGMAYNAPISLSGRTVNTLDEDEESSDEDEEPAQHQMQVQSAPTPNGNGEVEYEEEEEEEEEYDLAGMLEEALDEGEEESESEEE